MHVCPDEGTLRTTLDEPAGRMPGPSDPTPQGAAACPACRARADGLRHDRDAVAAALVSLEEPDEHGVDVDTALARFTTARPDLQVGAARRVRWIAAAAAVVVVALVVAIPGGRSALASALSTFRAERVAAVTIDPGTAGDLAALDAIADVDKPESEPVPVADLDEAAEVAGFRPSVVASPPAGDPVVLAAPAATVTATLSSERAPTLPSDLDGAELTITLSGMVVQEWSADEDVPELMVVDAGAPEVALAGADLAALREWVVTDPTLPPEVAAQLTALGDWTTTLPIPVMAGAQRDASVGDLDAVGVDYGMLRGVVWIDDGLVHGVAGVAPLEELEAVAEQLSR